MPLQPFCFVLIEGASCLGETPDLGRSFRLALVGVDDAVACVTLRPDEKEQVLSGWVCVDVADEVLSRGDRLAIDFEDDVAGGEASIFCGARGTYALDGDTLDLRGDVELLAGILVEVSYGEAELAALAGRRGRRCWRPRRPCGTSRP